MSEYNEDSRTRTQGASRAAMLHVLKSRAAEISLDKVGLVPDGKEILANRLGVVSTIGRRRTLGVAHSLASAHHAGCIPDPLAPSGKRCLRQQQLETLEYV